LLELLLLQPPAGLAEHSLVLAHGAVEAHEALAQALVVVADATARAVPALHSTITSHHISATWALSLRAVGTAEACIAHAANVLGSVPSSCVHRASCTGDDLRLCVAEAIAAAVVWAHAALAGDALVASEALALSRCSCTRALARALNNWVCIIHCYCCGCPCFAPVNCERARSSDITTFSTVFLRCRAG
jgi:hypothetical protein